MTLEQARERGLTRVRKPGWAFPDDVLILDRLENGTYGPWATLHSPAMARIRAERPDYDVPEFQRVLVLTDTASDWEAAP